MCARCENLRPVVNAFADAMMAKLHANHHKGDRDKWIEEETSWLLDRATQELAELYEAVTSRAKLADVLAEAADVANMVMMVADTEGALKVKA